MKEIMKRLISTALVMAMLLSFFPSTMFVVAKATDNVEKSPIDQSTYEALGFVTDLGTTNESYLTGQSQGKTTMNVKNELYLNLQSHKNYGWIMRDNLNLNNTPTTNYHNMGAYELYKHYKGGKYDKIDSDYGYTKGQTGGDGTVIGSSLSSEGYHTKNAYETSVALRSGSGKEDRVAVLYVESGAKRNEWVAKLQVKRFDGDDRYTISSKTINLGNAPALDEAGTIYQQYFDALYDITSGDFDGDGIDEVAVYFGTNEIRIYDVNSYGTLSDSPMETISADEILNDTTISGEYDSDNSGKIRRAAIVSLEAGDLTKDFQDELAVAVSMPQGSTENAHKKNTNAYVFEFEGTSATKALTVPLATDKLNSSTDANTPQVFKASNVAIGDIDGDSCMELVIGGRLANSTKPNDYNWSDAALIAVDVEYSYNNDTKKFDRIYKVGETHQFSLQNTGGMTNYGSANDRYTAPAGIAIADFDGSGEKLPRIFFFNELFEFQKDNQAQPFVHAEDGNGYLDTITNMRNNVNEKVGKSDHWISDVVVGNFNNNDAGAEQIIAILGCKESGSDWYWYYMSYMGYETETSGNKTIVKNNLMRSCEGIVNQGRSYINRSDVTRASTFVSIAAPDIDNDSILLEHIGTQSYYSKPEVQAVLQSAPYFADVAEVYENYLNNGETTYGTMTSESEGGTASVEAALGAYTHVEASIGAAAELEVELRATTSYEHATVEEVVKSVEFHGGVGDDYVVMYTIPYHRYYYNATFPGSDKTEIMFIDQPLTPSTVIVPVSTYDALAETTEGLEPIRGNILTSTPGDPSTYASTPKGTWTTFQSGLMLTNAGASNSETTASGEMSTTKENSFSIGIEENLNCGFGAGFLGTGGVIGLSQSLAVAGGGTYSNMSGVGFSGTVDNLPAGVEGYAFNWDFGYSKTKLNGEDIIVVGYKTYNVKQAPSLPKDITVAAVTSNSVTLEWGTGSDAAMYDVFVSGDQNEWLPLESVPATYATEDGKIYYTIKGLSSGNVYYFRINACNSYGIRSLETKPVFAQTLSENSSISILSQPQDTSAALGKDAKFSVEALGNGVSTINYQWFVRKPVYSEKGKLTGYSSWVTLSNNAKYEGTKSPTLIINDVALADEANQYRCRVNQTANYLYTNDAMLTVSKSPSTTSLALTVDGEDVTGKTVEASYTGTTPVKETVKEWANVVSNGYNKLSVKETETEVTSGGKTVIEYSYAEPYVWAKDGKYYADNNGASEYPVKHVFIYGESDTFTTSSTEETVSETIIYTSESDAENQVNGITVTKAYEISDNSYVYANVTTVTDNNETPDNTTDDITYEVFTYYAPVSEVTVGEGESAVPTIIYAEVSHHDDIITIDEVDYSVSQLVNVKEGTIHEVIVGYKTENNAGQTLTLTAEIKDNDGVISDTNGTVKFLLENAATGVATSVNGTKGADGKWTATYVFNTPGIYSVSALYNGDETYFSSSSADKLIYVTTTAKSLNISGGTMTYGGGFDLKPVIMQNASQSAATNVTYNVTKDGNAVTGCIEGNIFTPESAGVYTIDASVTEDGTTLTTSSVITVNKKTVTITAPTVEANVRDNNDTRLKAITDKGAEVTGITLSADDYTFSCEAVIGNIQSQGDYAINVELTAEAKAELSDKYNFVLMPGTLTLVQDKATVNAEAYANGSVRISYTTTITDSNGTYTSSPLTVESGSMLPVGAKVTVTAIPNSGFGVDKWVADGNPDELAGRKTEYSFILDENGADIDVYFELTYATLNFSAQTGGSVAGTYQGGSTEFKSGDSINASQNIVLTATPDDNHVVSYWTKNGEVIKAANGVDNYTGNTITVSGVSSTTTYTVHFAEKETAAVTVKFIHKLASGQEDVLGCGVTINGTDLTSTTNTFVYTTNKHDNLTISIDIPDNMLVDYWAKDGKVVANAVEEITVYDLSDDLEYIVYCETPNQREVIFNAEIVTDKTNGVLAGAGTLTAERNGTAIKSGVTLPQNSVVTFTATPSEGYRINKWTINGLTYSAVNSITVSDNTTVKVYFEKLPVVTITETADNGTANGFVGGSAIGNFVQFGDDVQIDITPNKGYVIDSVKVNGTDVTNNLVTPSVEGNGTDMRYYVIDDVERNTAVEVSYKELTTTRVTFGVIDKDEAENSGLDGTLTASVNRNNIPSYKVESASSPATVYEGSTVTFTATPASGYKVSKWFVNGVEVTAESALVIDGNTATLTIAKDMADQNVMVQFDLIGQSINYAINSENAEEKATISATFTANGSTSEFESGNRPTTNGTVTITVADIADGYEIEGWFVNGVKVEGETSATFEYDATVDVGAEIVVKIIRSSYEVTFEAVNGTVTATVESGALVKGDTNVTFTAQPKEATGYTFMGWTVNGTKSDVTAETLTIAITEKTVVKAEYELNEVKYTVTYGVIGENGTLTLGGFDKSPASVKAGSDLTFTATPKADYRVAGWYSDASGADDKLIAGFEQNTYSTTNLVADMAVYVKFEQIPRYDITINVEGLGTVTATVNGETAEITDGKLTVKRYDDVLLTAAPAEYQYFAGWTVDETTDTNLTLALNDVTADTSVKAAFAASQNITLKTIVGEGGTMTVKAGYGDNLTELDSINPTTGIVINRGQKVVFEITPDANKMVKSWKVNNAEMADYLDHEYIIENITADTVVEVEFENLKTFTVPSGTAQYTIENIEETPIDIGGVNVVRERGNVTFKVVPVSPNAITELEVSVGEGARIETTKNSNGTWTVTIEKVMANIVLNPTVVAGKPLTINCGAGGTVEVTLDGTKVENGYAFKADDVITINAKANSGFTLESLKLNTADFTSGKTYTVKADDIEIVIDATFKAAPSGGGGGGGFGGGGGGASATYPPVIEESDHGKLIVTPEEPAKGETVVITPVPDAGYMLDEIIVTDKNGDEIELEFKRDGTYTFEQPAGEVTIEGKFKEIVLPFEDVSNKAYYAEAVLWAVENGITTGVTPTLFMPDMTCTRAQAVTFLWRAAGSPAPKSDEMPFIDVPANAYYYDAVIWAVENGITTGTNDGSTFSPNMVCSRSQIVTLIARMEEAEKSEAENPFTDVKESDYYHNSVLWAVENYITKGTTDTTFEPVKDCTRAEIVTFLWRAFR